MPTSQEKSSYADKVEKVAEMLRGMADTLEDQAELLREHEIETHKFKFSHFEIKAKSLLRHGEKVLDYLDSSIEEEMLDDLESNIGTTPDSIPGCP